MKFKLLPLEEAAGCPFCGAQAEIAPWHGGGRDKRMIACSNDGCNAQPAVTGSNRKRALAAWNTRNDNGR